jgi:Flp pilus assembly protein TadG
VNRQRLSRIRSSLALRRSRPGAERGQAFLELAISLVFLLILFSFMIDVGYAFYTLMAMRDAAQEAASYGAICPLKDDGARNTDLIQQRLRTSATSPLDMDDIDAADISITYNDADGNPVVATDPVELAMRVIGGSVIVEFTFDHHILVPFLGAVIGRYEYPLTVTVADTIIRNKWLEQCSY